MSSINYNEEKILILFLHKSTGELFVGLPIVWYLKKVMNVNVYFVSNCSDILSQMNVSDRYIEIMRQLGSFNFGRIKSLSLLAKLYFSDKTIVQMSCLSGRRRIDRIYYSLLKKTTMVFFPHSFALHQLNDMNNIAINSEFEFHVKSKFQSRYGSKGDLLINSSKELNYFRQSGWSLNSIHFIGALGYSKAWLNNFFNTNNVGTIETRKGPLKIFIPLRDSHPYYLTESNYKYQISSLVKIFEKFSSFHFIVKLHPRQQVKELKEIFGKYSNVSFSSKSPFELALKSDLTLAFFTSAITDSVAIGTPALEFHRHVVSHPQLVNKDGKLVSLYEYLGLCTGYDDVKPLEEFLQNIDEKKLKELHKKQYQKLIDIFELNSDYEANLKSIFETLYARADISYEEQKDEKEKVFDELFVNIIKKVVLLPKSVICKIKFKIFRMEK